MKKFLCVLFALLLLLAACSPAVSEISADVSEEISKDTSEQSREASETDLPDIDVETTACVAIGDKGIAITHKNVTALPVADGCILIEPKSTNSLAVPSDRYAVLVKRNVKGDFEVVKVGAQKADTKYFTLIFTGETAMSFAKQNLTVGSACRLYNTDLVSSFGDGIGINVGKYAFEVAAVNPTAAVSGVSIYDEKSGIGVSPSFDGDFTDVLVFDGYIVKISEQNQTTVLPYPMGCLIRFAGSAAAYASSVKVGDAVEAVGFEIETSPKEYVAIGGGKVEIAYKNETRTSVAYAVIYDSDFIYNTTNTNIWGAEVAVDKYGVITSIVKGNVEGAGNTAIPEGGYVLSSGLSANTSLMYKASVGDTAKHVVNDSFYDYRAIKDVYINKYGETGEECINLISYDFSSRTRNVQNAVYYSVNSEGYVTDIGYSVCDVPVGGFVLVATGVKRTELMRFCGIGSYVSRNDLLSRICVIDVCSKSVCLDQLAELKSAVDTAKQSLVSIAYQTVEDNIASIEQLLKTDDPRDTVNAAKLILNTQNALSESLVVEERSAWIVNRDTDIESAYHTVAYAKGLGLNTLIYCPISDGYATYNTSVNHLYKLKSIGEADILQAYIDASHAAGMRFICMICTFIVDKPSDAYPDDHYFNYYSDKLLVSKSGRTAAYFYDSPSYTLNPNDSQVRSFYKAIIKEIAANYDVDGIMLDYIRFPLPTYFGVENYEDMGYNDDIIAGFQKKYGTKKNPKDLKITDALWVKWCDYRRSIITSFVKEAYVAAGSKELYVTCFASYKDRQNYVFQDVELWAEKGYVAAIYCMGYTADTAEFETNSRELIEGVAGNCHVMLGLGTYDGETPEIIEAEITCGRELGADGYAIFALQYVQIHGFDEYYKNKFRNSAVGMYDALKVSVAYFEWLNECVNSVYCYLYPDINLSKLSKELLKYASSQSCGTDVPRYCYLTKKEFKAVRSLMASSDAPTEVKEDFYAKIDRIYAILDCIWAVND